MTSIRGLIMRDTHLYIPNSNVQGWVKKHANRTALNIRYTGH